MMAKGSLEGEALFAMFCRSFPLNGKAGNRGRVDSVMLSHDVELGTFYQQARELRIKHRLGIFSRARVVRRFQQLLIDAGYHREVVNRVVIALVLSAMIR